MKQCQINSNQYSILGGLFFLIQKRPQELCSLYLDRLRVKTIYVFYICLLTENVLECWN